LFETIKLHITYDDFTVLKDTTATLHFIDLLLLTKHKKISLKTIVLIIASEKNAKKLLKKILFVSIINN
jgi:hypothetical protein